MRNVTKKMQQIKQGENLTLLLHIRASLALGIPLIAAQLVTIAIGVTDTLMLGWLGVEPLAAGVLGTQIVFITWLFGSGFSVAIMPLAANAIGSGDERGVRRSVRMGLWIGAIYCFLGILFLSFSQHVFIFLSQPYETSLLASKYVNIAMWSIVPILLYSCLRSFLTTLNFSGIVLWGTLAGAILNGFLNYMLIFGNWGAPKLGVEGAAYASLATSTLIAISFVGFIIFNQETQKYTIFSRIWRPDWEAFFELFRLGAPISISMLSEVSLFGISSIMIGWLGTVPLAAHGIVLQLASITFMIPLALSQAATVRVGTALGRNNWQEIKGAGEAMFLIVILAMLACSLLFFFLPGPLIELFLDLDDGQSAKVKQVAIQFIYVAAIFQLVDGVQIMAGGLLRGLKDTTIPMLLSVFSYWGIGASSAYLLGFAFDWQGVGVWSGLALGLAGAAFLLTVRFYLILKKRS